MAKPITLSVRSKWRKKPTDCRECVGCVKPIYSSNMYVFYIKTNVITVTKLALCESCHEAIKEEEL